MTSPDVEAIVKRLTEAQRTWLVCPDYIDPNSIRALRRRGIIGERQRGLTDFGRLIRAHILSQEQNPS